MLASLLNDVRSGAPRVDPIVALRAE